MTQSSEIKVIERTVALSNEWLKQLDSQLGWNNKQRTYRLFRETLHALRDCLGVNEVAHLASEMPMLIRGIYYEGWQPSATPIADNDREAFVLRIDRAFKNDPLDDTEAALQQVFNFLGQKISAGEIGDVRKSLPKTMRQLWAA
jgi:uncharacterized protein (DUF2267 family)